jgi:gliding motility-associated-like protein
LPVITVAPTSTTICSGTTAGLAATNGLSVYNWTPSASIVGSSNTSAVVVDPSATTIYTVSAMDAFGCLSNTVTAQVNVTDISASASANPVCKGQTINLTGNTLNGASYAWTGPNGFTSSSQNPNIPNSTLADAGNYTLTVTHAGCVAVSTVSVTVNPLPIVTVSPPQTVCPNAPAVYTATGASTYTWSPSTGLSASTGSIVTATATLTTNYTVTGTDQNGCSASASTTVSVNPVTAVIAADPPTGDIPLNVAFVNTTSGGTTYNWNYGNGSTTYTTNILNDPNTNTMYTTPGTYTVTMTATNATGCTSVSTLLVIVTEAFTITIPNVFTPNGDGVNDYFFIKSTGLAAIEMVIYDRWGLKMWESTSATGTWDGKNSNDGTYFYVIKATSTKSQTTEYKGPLLLIK